VLGGQLDEIQLLRLFLNLKTNDMFTF
jgi:hypothetical protein